MNHSPHAEVKVKDLVDTFLTKFNTNIQGAIEELNASDQDFDTIDLDMSDVGKDENGNPITVPTEDGDVDASTLYQSGRVITVKGKGADYYMTIADQMIEKLRAQMLAKAQAMCTANGVEFDATVFNGMFNNAKATAEIFHDISAFETKRHNSLNDKILELRNYIKKPSKN